MPKLIVLRGNSGAGKSTVAQKLREVSLRRIAWIEQDHFRRHILREKDGTDGIRIGLIAQTVDFVLANGYDVILEGIFGFSAYGEMLRALAARWPEHYFFYFDVPFEETLRRHATRPSAKEFGRAEMARWFRNDDRTGFPGEIIIPAENSITDAVQLIKSTAQL